MTAWLRAQIVEQDAGTQIQSHHNVTWGREVVTFMKVFSHTKFE